MNKHNNKFPYYTFKKKGKYFLYEINKFAIFEISQLCFKILKSTDNLKINEVVSKFRKEYSAKQIKNAYFRLQKWGLLKEDYNNDELEDVCVNPFQHVKEQRTHFIDGMYMVVSQDCNLRCKYCSAGYGTFGKEENRGLMSQETAKKSIDFLLSHLQRDLKEPVITFVGGEPLLNFEIIKFVVGYLKTNPSLRPVYMFNTNGTLLNDEMAKWLVDNNIPVRFSIDGTKEIHDENRVFKNGKGSYNKVIEGLTKYLKYNRKGFTVQTSIPFGTKIVKAVHALWRLGANNVLAHITAQSAFVDTEKYNTTKTHWRKYNTGLEKLNCEIINNLVKKGCSPMIHNALETVGRLYTHKMNYRGCGVLRVISVDINGNFYPCQGFVGFYDYIIGDLDKGFNYDAIEKFGDLYAQYLSRCNSCWAKNLCGAACIALSIQYNEMDERYKPSRWCDSYKKAIQSSIYLYSFVLQKRPELFKELFFNK